MSVSPSIVSSVSGVSAAAAAEAAVEAISGAAGQEVVFSLELTQDQKDIRDWVHGFAVDVVRPTAHEWDEREQTPWPVIEEAAKIGLYGFEGLAQFFADPTGLTLPLVNEELFWGDAGIGMSIMGTALAVAAIFGQGSGEQISEWIPRCFGTADDVKVAAFCSSEPDAGSDVSAIRTTARLDEAAGEWVLNGQKAWATNGGIADVHVVIASVDRALGRAATLRLSSRRARREGSRRVRRSQSTVCAPRTRLMCISMIAGIPVSYVLGGAEKLEEHLVRARDGKRSRRIPRRRCRPSRPRGRPLVRRRSGSRVRRMSTRSTMPASAAVRPQDHREPGDRVHARAYEAGDRRGAPALWRASWMGATRVRFRERGGLNEQAEGW